MKFSTAACLPPLGLQRDRPTPRGVPPSASPLMNHAALVRSVKERQRDDPDFNEAWETYCDEYAGGTKDPNRQTLVFLRKALREIPSSRSRGRVGRVGAGGGRGGGGGGRGGRGSRTSNTDALVERVKTRQRDPAWQTEWCAFCDEESDGTYDPALHTADFLRRALRTIRVEEEDDDEENENDDDDDEIDHENPALVEEVKTNQKDPAWHTRWLDYCHAYGDGTRDPARHTVAFLETALAALQNSDFAESDEHEKAVAEVKRRQKEIQGWNANWERYCKRFSDGTNDPVKHELFFLNAAMDDIDKRLEKTTDHKELVTKVKAAQRDDPTWRTRWADYCQEYADGTRDPAHHEVSFLKQALRDLAPEDEEHRMGLRNNAAEHSRLVEEVKRLRRADVRFRNRWVDYCETRSDGTLDPEKHDVGFLRKAIREMTTSRRTHDLATQQRIDEIQLLCDARRKAQRAKAFERADNLRSMLWSMGVEVNDKKKAWRSDDGFSGTFDDPDNGRDETNYEDRWQGPGRRRGRGERE